jgi:hypothetical protein
MIDPALTALRRLPPAATAAAVGSLTVGLILGRKLGRRKSY